MSPMLQDRVAIITGAGRGIGRAYALRFAREGAKVVIAEILLENAQKVAREVESAGGTAMALQTDVSLEASTIEMAKKTVERFGKIDILVNNAAIYYGLPRKPWHTWTVEEWDRIFAVNVRGVWLCCKAVAPHMQQQKRGKIVNIASGTASGTPGAAQRLHYATSKGAVITMTRLLARAMGEHNICVNCIAPGATMTEASLAGLDAGGSASLKSSTAQARCIKREEVPEDLVGAAVFLSSEDSDFVTGQILPVDGGSWLR
jgi:3-oxoacyl-[acyl-carrier protein] reductase